MNELALFAGAGGGILGGKLLGWRTICAVESESYPASVLVSRQNDGSLAPFPVWDDVRTFDGYPWRGLVDVISGGFPCQDISAAGKGAGLAGARSGLWSEFARIIGEVRPTWCFIENSPLLRTRGLNVVLADLDRLGYDAEWCVLGADAPPVAFGSEAPAVTHNRDRIWIAAVARADADRMRESQSQGCKPNQRGRTGNMDQAAPSDAMRVGRRSLRLGMDETSGAGQGRQDPTAHGFAWFTRDPADDTSLLESRVGRVADGVARRVDQLRAIGNGQVPAVAALAWQILTTRLLDHR